MTSQIYFHYKKISPFVASLDMNGLPLSIKMLMYLLLPQMGTYLSFSQKLLYSVLRDSLQTKLLHPTKSQVFVLHSFPQVIILFRNQVWGICCLPSQALSLVVVKHLSLSLWGVSSTLGFFLGEWGELQRWYPHSSSEDTSHRAKKQGSFIKRDGIGSKAIWATGVASSEEQVWTWTSSFSQGNKFFLLASYPSSKCACPFLVLIYQYPSSRRSSSSSCCCCCCFCTHSSLGS